MADQFPPARRPPLQARTAACLAVVLCFLPAAAHAQKYAFVDAFVRFHSKLIGTYGDEGPQLAAAVADMAASLEVWDRDADASEARLTAGLGGLPADRAILQIDRGRLIEAVASMEAAIAQEPARSDFHRLHGLLLEAAGRTGDALEALATAWMLDRTDPMTAYLLADRRIGAGAGGSIEPQVASLLAAYGRSGALLRGRRPFRQFALVDDRGADTPIFSPVRYAAGLQSFANGRYGDAIAQFRTALAHDPLVTAAVVSSEEGARGVAAFRDGRAAEAITLLEAAVAQAPESSEAHRILGSAYRVQRDFARSVEHLKTAVRLAPEDERAHVALGRALLDAGLDGEAEAALLETIRILPQSGESRWALADVYEKTGRPTDAIQVLEAAASLTVLAGKYQLYWRIAEIAHLQQDYERVARVLGLRARLVPNEAGAHKDLGLAYMRLGRPNEALVELVTTALLGMEDAGTLAAIGQIHLDAGRLVDAEAMLQRAVALQPDLPQARYALGTALVRLGRRDEGRAHLATFQKLRSAAFEQQQNPDPVTSPDPLAPSSPEPER